MASTEPTIPLNAKTIGFVMSIVGILAVGWNVAGFFYELKQKNFEQDLRLEQSDRDREVFKTNIKDLTSKTGELKEAVVRLTTVLENKGLSKKVHYAPDEFDPITTDNLLVDIKAKESVQ